MVDSQPQVQLHCCWGLLRRSLAVTGAQIMTAAERRPDGKQCARPGQLVVARQVSLWNRLRVERLMVELPRELQLQGTVLPRLAGTSVQHLGRL